MLLLWKATWGSWMWEHGLLAASAVSTEAVGKSLVHGPMVGTAFGDHG